MKMKELLGDEQAQRVIDFCAEELISGNHINIPFTQSKDRRIQVHNFVSANLRPLQSQTVDAQTLKISLTLKRQKINHKDPKNYGTLLPNFVNCAMRLKNIGTLDAIKYVCMRLKTD